MIQHQMPFFYPAALIFDQSLENFSKVRPQLLDVSTLFRTQS
jgi:hypothetical protein